MHIKTVLFDLDGTLLPRDQDVFVKAYLSSMATAMEKHGYEKESFLKSIWDGIRTMEKNDGKRFNETVFMERFSTVLGHSIERELSLLEAYYQTDFQEIRLICGKNEKAVQAVEECRRLGLRTVLATNPLFPSIATESRIRWAGLSPDMFEAITTYENSCYAKPNPNYYTALAEQLGVLPEECLMVGNDVRDDMIASTVGMKVFLLTDCLLNREGRDASHYPQGNFDDLTNHIKSLV